MKNIFELGVGIRHIKESNYFALWNNNRTERYTVDDNIGLIQLPTEESEFYDVSLGTKCTTGKCSFCYAAARTDGKYYENPSDLWLSLYEKLWWRYRILDIKKFISEEGLPQDALEPLAINILTSMKELGGKKPPVFFTNAPFQIAIGSGSEPTEHPDFCKFIKTVWKTKVIPNYTTNGVILGYSGNDSQKSKLRDDILAVTADCSAGVAVSFGNPALRGLAEKALRHLSMVDTKVVLHHIISTNESVDEFLKIRKEWTGKIHYHVLLPLMKHGRSSEGMGPETYKYLMECLVREGKENIGDVAFGAKFIPYLDSWNPLGIQTFAEQTYSKNLLLADDRAIFTPSSFDLKTIKEIKLV